MSVRLRSNGLADWSLARAIREHVAECAAYCTEDGKVNLTALGWELGVNRQTARRLLEGGTSSPRSLVNQKPGGDTIHKARQAKMRAIGGTK